MSSPPTSTFDGATDAQVEWTEEELLERSSFLVKLSKRRLAPIRYAQLLSSARSNRCPKEPASWECCGSSCKPCVRELWREEKRVWEECHPEGEEPGESDREEEDELEAQEPESKKDQGKPAVEIGIERRFEEAVAVKA